MINNPQSLTEQLLNLVERQATEMRVILNTLLGKVSKTDLLSKGSEVKPIYFDEDGNALPITSFDGISSKASFAEKDYNGNIITEHYLSKDSANSLYLSKNSASADYINKTDADSKYIGKSADIDFGNL